jgi:hypothetical protein
MQQTEGVFGISYANREKNLGFTEEQMTKLRPIVRTPGNSYHFFDRCTMAVYHTPMTGTADEVSYLADQVDDGMHLLVVVSPRNRNEMETLKKSELVRELLKRYDIGEISYSETNAGVILPPPSEEFRNFREESGRNFRIHDFFLEACAFEYKLSNSEGLYFLKGQKLVEKEEPPLIVHFNSMPNENVSFYRWIMPRNSVYIDTRSTKWRDDSKIVHDFKLRAYIKEDKKKECLDNTSEHKLLFDLWKFDLKADVFRNVGNYGSLVQFFGFDFLIQENYDVFLKMLQESAKSRPHVLRAKEEKEKHIVSDISTY